MYMYVYPSVLLPNYGNSVNKAKVNAFSTPTLTSATASTTFGYGINIKQVSNALISQFVS